MNRSLTQRVHDLGKPRNKETAEYLIQRCLSEAATLATVKADRYKVDGHLRRTKDAISALSLLTQDHADIVAQLSARVPALEKLSTFSSHPLTIAMFTRKRKVEDAEKVARTKIAFWSGTESLIWLMTQNGWTPEFLLEYVTEHLESIAEDDTDAIVQTIQATRARAHSQDEFWHDS